MRTAHALLLVITSGSLALLLPFRCSIAWPLLLTAFVCLFAPCHLSAKLGRTQQLWLMHVQQAEPSLLLTRMPQCEQHPFCTPICSIPTSKHSTCHVKPASSVHSAFCTLPNAHTCLH